VRDLIQSALFGARFKILLLLRKREEVMQRSHRGEAPAIEHRSEPAKMVVSARSTSERTQFNGMLCYGVYRSVLLRNAVKL